MAVSRLHPSPPPPIQHQQQQHHHHHIASTLMSCVRESSPVEDLEEAPEDPAESCGGGLGGGGEGRKQGRHESKKRRFHPLRGLRRIFRRKSRRSPEDGDQDILPQSSAIASSSFGRSAINADENRDSGCTGTAAGDLDEAYRSRSASELLSGEEEEEDDGSPEGSGRRRGSDGRTSGEMFQDSLRHSVSHDSVFSSGERRVSSGGGGTGAGGSRPAQPLAPSSSAQQVAAHQGVRAELFDAVRRRRWRSRSKDREEENEADRETGESAAATRSSDDEEDLGLPRSPCNSPSSGEAGLRSEQKEVQSKSHSTCSEGSLLSMGSSDMDEDSQGHFSGHSSKLSLHEKSSSQFGSDLELDVGSTAEPLSHSAARHKMSIRPKRTHGAPRLRRLKEVTSLGSLPTTPEVNEDSGRCSSPEISFNQESSTAEHIQVPSDNLHLNSSSITVAAEIPQRTSQSHTTTTNSTIETLVSCMPEVTSASSKSITNQNPYSPLTNNKEEDKGLEYSNEDIFNQDNSTEISTVNNSFDSVQVNNSENIFPEEAIGTEDSENGGTTLLSRILSWRGSKKKMDDPSEGAALMAEGAPSRRMDVHGRYVHEVICETSGGIDQPPPSPGWRPAPFSTSWPPLHHSTPRSYHTSTHHIPAGREDRESNTTEEVICTEFPSNFSGPRSLPLMMQYEATESLHEKSSSSRSASSRQMMPSPSETYSIRKLPPMPDEAQPEVAPLKCLNFKANDRQENNHTFTSTSEAPESLLFQFERNEFELNYPMLHNESLIKVDTIEDCTMEKVVPDRDTFMMSSVEGLLTLDVSGNSEMKINDVSEEMMSQDCIMENDGINEGGIKDEWEEAHRGLEEEILFSASISVPENDNILSIVNSQSKVMFHTNLGQAEEGLIKKGIDSINIDNITEPQVQTVVDEHPEDSNVHSASTTKGLNRYKRTQSMPIANTVSQTSDVPEFLRVQLIHVDSRPTTNVVLHSTGGIPVSVNPPEACDTPGRRRVRPRSADSLDSGQSSSREIVNVVCSSKSRINDNEITLEGNKAESKGVVSKEKKVSAGGKNKISSRDSVGVVNQNSVGVVNQNDFNQTKDVLIPGTTQQNPVKDISERGFNSNGTSIKEQSVDQCHNALIRESSEITVLKEDCKIREPATSLKIQRKVSEDVTNKTGVPVKDKEEGRLKVLVRESLGSIATQNSENKSKDAALPPKAQRKFSDESTAEVVPRRKSIASKDLPSQNKDEEPELFKVFARRSLKVKDSDTWENNSPSQQQFQQRSRDSDKENEGSDSAVDVVILPAAKEQKQRESSIKSECLKEIDPIVKPSQIIMQTDVSPQLRRIPSSNGLFSGTTISGGNGNTQSIYSNDKSTVVEIPRAHRSSIGGSLPRREGPSPEKRARGVSVNLPPESHPYRVNTNRGAGVGSEMRRPLWATQIQADESYGRTVSSDITDQALDLGFNREDDLKPHFKGIQQRKEEWELRSRMK